MFNTGDTVSYGTSGVCTIAEKKRLTLGGQPHECFILRPVFDASMKICVPCDSTPLLQKMRAMPTRDELLSLLREPAPTHDPDPEVRRETYREALKSGSLHELIAMVRDIYTERTLRRAKGKQLSAYEDSALRNAQNALHSEFAYVMGIRPDEVPAFIEKELNKAEQQPVLRNRSTGYLLFDFLRTVKQDVGAGHARPAT